jgi:hypothetical protein
MPFYPKDSQISSPAVPATTFPGYLKTVIDPTWHNPVVRIADQTAMSSSDVAIRHVYSKIQPWNADGTMIKLDFTYPCYILDGNTYAFQKLFHNLSYSIWGNTLANKNIVFGTGGNRFARKQDITGADFNFTNIYDFGATCLYCSLGEGEGNIDNNDTYGVFLWSTTSNHASGNNISCVRLTDGTLMGTLSIGTSWPDWAGMSQSGNYVIVNWGATDNGVVAKSGVEVYNTAMTFQRQVATYGEHGDVGYDPAGNEVWVGYSHSSGTGGETLDMWRLDGVGGKTKILPVEASFPEAEWGHVSCRNIKRPGWVYLSGYSNNYTNAVGQIYAAKLDSSRTVEVFAHHQATYPNPGYNYQPQPCPSPDGTRVMFASDWKQYVNASTPSYAYVATGAAYFTIPNQANATYSDQSEPDKTDFDIVTAGVGRTGVRSGGVVAAQQTPDMTVKVTASTLEVGGIIVSTAAVSSLTIGVGDSTNPRFDLVVANLLGTVSVLAGTPAAGPVFPALGGNQVVLAAIYVPANATTITNNQINDKRVMLALPTHLEAVGSSPTAVAGANAGTSPPAPVVGSGSNDVRGKVTWGTGTTPAAGAQVVVTFAQPYLNIPVVMLNPDNSGTRGLSPYVSNISTTGFTISCTATPTASQANNTWSAEYLVVG